MPTASKAVRHEGRLRCTQTDSALRIQTVCEFYP